MPPSQAHTVWTEQTELPVLIPPPAAPEPVPMDLSVPPAGDLKQGVVTTGFVLPEPFDSFAKK